jgi:hypothetical protein
VVEVFPVLDAAHPFQAGQSAAAVEPPDGALDNPTLGQHDEA